MSKYKVIYVDGTDEVIEADSYSVPDQKANTSAWIHFMATHMAGATVEAARYVRSIREAEVKTVTLVD